MDEAHITTVPDTLDAIDKLTLPHPASALLATFVREAVNPEAAAVYAAKQLSSGQAQSFVLKWIHVIESVGSIGKSPPPLDKSTIQAIIRRDGNRCCVSGRPASLLDPLVVVPILPIPSGWLEHEPRYLEMLCAFFGRAYLDWWCSIIDVPESISPFSNHWLVTSSTSRALRNGTVRLLRQMPSMVEYNVDHVIIDDTEPVPIRGNHALLGDWSRSGIETVDARFVGSHARFCKGLQLVNITKCAAPELLSSVVLSDHKPQQPQPPLSPVWRTPSAMSVMSRLFTKPLEIIWSILPTSIRIAAYEVLRRIGRRWYGVDDENTTVQRLPFGLYLKYQGDISAYRNEFNALKMVEHHTSISAPRALDVVTKVIQDADEEDPFNFGPVAASYLLITRVPGIPLASAHEAISDVNLHDVCQQLQEYISQVRSMLNKTQAGGSIICNTLGQAIRDPRIRGGDPIGPFASEAAFNQELRNPDDASRKGHEIVFTHADLNPRNILVRRVKCSDGNDRWQISGIVDWEAAGYYPEYWDCTKALFERFRWPKRYNDMVKKLFSRFGDYKGEIDVEMRSWEAGDGV